MSLSLSLRLNIVKAIVAAATSIAADKTSCCGCRRSINHVLIALGRVAGSFVVDVVIVVIGTQTASDRSHHWLSDDVRSMINRVLLLWLRRLRLIELLLIRVLLLRLHQWPAPVHVHIRR